MLTADDFREIVLDMNDAAEGAHMGHPDFRANGRIFASLNAKEDQGTVKLTPEEQQELMRAYPKVFMPAAGAWGRQGWTVVQLSAATKTAVRTAVLLAWQNVTSMPRKAKSAKRRSRRV
jgi:hypothetical protein